VELLDGANVVSSADAHVYEAVHEQWLPNAHVEWHIALSNTIAKDTRIPPKGFVAGPTTPILGASYGDGFDEAMASIAIPPSFAASSVTVRASVLYQATLKEMVDALANANTTDMRGQTLRSVFAATGNAAPLSIASAEAVITITPMPGEGPPTKTGGCSCTQSPTESGNGTWLALALAVTAFRGARPREASRRCRSPR
jgi:hypothetical protein